MFVGFTIRFYHVGFTRALESNRHGLNPSSAIYSLYNLGDSLKFSMPQCLHPESSNYELFLMELVKIYRNLYKHIYLVTESSSGKFGRWSSQLPKHLTRSVCCDLYHPHVTQLL